MRFGLEARRPRTLEEVGAELGVTRERIRQIEAKTLARLRSPLMAERLHRVLAVVEIRRINQRTRADPW